MRRTPLSPLPLTATLTAAVALLAACGARPNAAPTPASPSTSPTASRSGGPLMLDPKKDYGNRFADGVLPVGDGHYQTTGARRGYVYACNGYAHALSGGGEGGAQSRGSWFSADGKTYDVAKKVKVSGSVRWPDDYRVKVSGSTRYVETNDLPDHTTGTFPISPSDPAYSSDRNPNSISTQHVSLALARTPTYGAPQCMSGQVGVMITGAELFNGFDAGGHDAGAWEVQDGCSGHPQRDGAYHYHTISACIHGTSLYRVIGWALDGYPITGPVVSKGDVLTTKDLDECHGITSRVKVDGQWTTTYHYVMTQDFPYSVSCFRSPPINVDGH